MGIWSKTINSSKTVFDINEEGVLIKCSKREGTVIIPDNVVAVARNAFEGCDKVRVSYSPNYIVNKLSHTLSNIIETLQETSASKNNLEDENIFLVFDLDSDLIVKALEDVKYWQEHFSEEKLNLLEIEAREIVNLSKQIDSNNYRISSEGNGILLIKNLTKEIYDTLPMDFIYNLLRNQTFYKESLNPKWLVVVDVKKGVKLESSEVVGKVFQGEYYYDIPAERYIKEMEMDKRIVESEDLEIGPKEEISSQVIEVNKIEQNDAHIIDWEERHFQICLALIQGEATKKIGSSFPYQSIIKIADRMVEALRNHHEEKFKNLTDE